MAKIMEIHNLDKTENLHRLYLARQKRLRTIMKAVGLPALVILDPGNITYACGARNMPIFGQRIPARYLLLIAEGPAILYEYAGSEHLAINLPTLDDIRPALGLCQISSGEKADLAANRFTEEIVSVFKDLNLEVDQLGIDRFPFPIIDTLRGAGFELRHADDALIPARAIKQPEELHYMREAIRRVEHATKGFEEKIKPGLREVDIWAELHHGLIIGEGQYLSTRLCQSGDNTFPYFQECGPRVLAAGDLICLDTDAIGYHDYAVDFSRSFLCGDQAATNIQKKLYGRALEQLETNAGLLKAGIEYRELAEKTWKVPDEHQASRYYCIGHGLGMSGEFPNIPHVKPGQEYPLKGHLEAGMVICIESYIGSEKSAQGVKLEDQFLIGTDQIERLSNYRFDSRLK
jgi:Xaa-Pro dipeptidase